MQPAMKAEDDESVRMNGIVCSRWIVSNNIPFVMKQKLEILNPVNQNWGSLRFFMSSQLGTFIFVCLSNISVNTNKCADLITLQRSTEQRMNLSIRQMIHRDKVPKFYYGLYAYEVTNTLSCIILLSQFIVYGGL